jgi:hypothetical protein
MVLLMLISFTGCDRFDNTFTPAQTPDVFVKEFAVATEMLRERNIAGLLDFYADDYMNNGTSKDSLTTFFSSYEWTENAEISLSQNSHISYTFYVKDLDNEVNKNWTDIIGLVGKHYRWVGNTLSEPLPPPKQLVLAQSLTYITCQYCPKAKRELKQLEAIYEGSFIFLSYDSRPREPFAYYNAFIDERTYWDNPDQPFVIFQGQRAEISADPEVLSKYRENIEYYRNQDTEIEINNLQFLVNRRTIGGAVELSYKNLDKENLYLYYAIYEEYTDVNYQNSADGEVINFGNVVIGRGQHLLEGLYDGKAVTFELEAQTDLDTETDLVVWVQRIENLGRIGTNDKVLNVVRQAIIVP